jgi:hypothetical protein
MAENSGGIRGPSGHNANRKLRPPQVHPKELQLSPQQQQQRERLLNSLAERARLIDSEEEKASRDEPYQMGLPPWDEKLLRAVVAFPDIRAYYRALILDANERLLFRSSKPATETVSRLPTLAEREKTQSAPADVNTATPIYPSFLERLARFTLTESERTKGYQNLDPYDDPFESSDLDRSTESVGTARGNTARGKGDNVRESNTRDRGDSARDRGDNTRGRDQHARSGYFAFGQSVQQNRTGFQNQNAAPAAGTVTFAEVASAPPTDLAIRGASDGRQGSHAFQLTNCQPKYPPVFSRWETYPTQVFHSTGRRKRTTAGLEEIIVEKMHPRWYGGDRHHDLGLCKRQFTKGDTCPLGWEECPLRHWMLDQIERT